jgi:hypothetical protein
MLHRQPGAPAEHGAAQRHSGALPVTRPRAVPAGHPAPGGSGRSPGRGRFRPVTRPRANPPRATRPSCHLTPAAPAPRSPGHGIPSAPATEHAYVDVVPRVRLRRLKLSGESCAAATQVRTHVISEVGRVWREGGRERERRRRARDDPQRISSGGRAASGQYRWTRVDADRPIGDG